MRRASEKGVRFVKDPSKGASMRVRVKAGDLENNRWDPQYWDPEYANPLATCVHPISELGEFIKFITYGPIVTGKKPKPVSKGIGLILLRCIISTKHPTVAF